MSEDFSYDNCPGIMPSTLIKTMDPFLHQKEKISNTEEKMTNREMEKILELKINQDDYSDKKTIDKSLQLKTKAESGVEIERGMSVQLPVKDVKVKVKGNEDAPQQFDFKESNLSEQFKDLSINKKDVNQGVVSPFEFKERELLGKFKDLTIKERSKYTEMCPRLPTGGVPVSFDSSHGDEINPIKCRKPSHGNSGGEMYNNGAVADLQTPIVNVFEPKFPDVKQGSPGDVSSYSPQASPSDSGYAPSPPQPAPDSPTSRGGLELPPEIDQLVAQFMNVDEENDGTALAELVTTKLDKWCKSMRSCYIPDEVITAKTQPIYDKISAFLAQNGCKDDLSDPSDPDLGNIGVSDLPDGNPDLSIILSLLSEPSIRSYVDTVAKAKDIQATMPGSYSQVTGASNYSTAPPTAHMNVTLPCTRSEMGVVSTYSQVLPTSSNQMVRPPSTQSQVAAVSGYSRAPPSSANQSYSTVATPSGGQFTGSVAPSGQFTKSGTPNGQFTGSVAPSAQFTKSGTPSGQFTVSRTPGSQFTGSGSPSAQFTGSGSPNGQLSGVAAPMQSQKRSSGSETPKALGPYSCVQDGPVVPITVSEHSVSPVNPLSTPQVTLARPHQGMRTESVGMVGGGARVGVNLDITQFAVCVTEADKKSFTQCQAVIAGMNDDQILHTDSADEDTLLHKYMIYSPDPEEPAPDSERCLPRPKMIRLLYCLLQRMDQMEKAGLMHLRGPQGFINRKNKRGQTALFIASIVNFPEAIQMFLHYGADPNLRRTFKSFDETAPIHKVLENGDRNLRMLEILISSDKCDLNLKNHEGCTPLMIACRLHNTVRKSGTVHTVQCVKLLLQSPKVDLFAKIEGSGRSAIHFAVEKEDLELMKAWGPYASRISCSGGPGDCNPDGTPRKLVNITDRDGNNVLHILAGLHTHSTPVQIKIAQLLTQVKADVTVKNGDGKRPRELAKSMRNDELQELFIMPKPSRKQSHNQRYRTTSQSRYSGNGGHFSTNQMAENGYDFSQSAHSLSGMSSSTSSAYESGDSHHGYSPPPVVYGNFSNQPVLALPVTQRDLAYLNEFSGQILPNGQIITTQQSPQRLDSCSSSGSPHYNSSTGSSPLYAPSPSYAPSPARYQSHSPPHGYANSVFVNSPQYGASPSHVGGSPGGPCGGSPTGSHHSSPRHSPVYGREEETNMFGNVLTGHRL